MKILILTPYFPPDLGPGAAMVGMLADDLRARGHEMQIIAAVPHYPSGEVSWGYRERMYHESTQDGILVGRVRIPGGDRSDLGHRVFAYLIYQLVSSIYAFSTKCDLILATNPAIETGVPFLIVAGLRRKPGVWLVWDLYPEIGIRLGIFHSRPVKAIVGWLENRCLRAAARVQSLSAEFIPSLRTRVGDAHKIALIPPWIDLDFICPLERRNGFSHEFGLDGYFIVLYSGNIGRSQGLENMLECARLLKGEQAILFAIVGEGASKDLLQETVERKRLDNVRFIPYQPQARLPEVLASADISLVSLRSGLSHTALPSKALAIMAAARPVIAAADLEGELAHLIQVSGAGLCVKPDCPEELASAILWLYAQPDQRAEMGDCGRRYVQQHVSRQRAAESFENMFKEIEAEVAG